MTKIHNINQQSYNNRRLKFFIYNNVSYIKGKDRATLWINKNWDSHKFEELHRSLFFQSLSVQHNTRWRSLVRHCASSRKLAGSIPDGVIGIFH